MKCLLFALLVVVCLAHQPHHRRHGHATPQRVNDATSALLSRLETDVKKLLEEEEAGVTGAALTSIQTTWFNPAPTSGSTLFTFLRNNFALSGGGEIAWDTAKIRYQSGTAMASIGCRAKTNDVDAWMFLASGVNTVQYSKDGLKFTGDKTKLRKLSIPADVPLGEASKISTTQWTFTELGPSEEVEEIYRIENFPSSRRGEGYKADNEPESAPVRYPGVSSEDVRGTLLHGGSNTYVVGDVNPQDNLWHPQSLPCPSGFSDVELDIYFPSSHAYKYFWESAQPSDTDTTPYVTNAVCLMMKSSDVRRYRKGPGKALNDANDACCLCSRPFPDGEAGHKGFGSAAQRDSFCKVVKLYGSKYKENTENCGSPAALDQTDATNLASLATFWDGKKSEFKELETLATMLNALKTEGTPEKMTSWINANAWKE